METVHEKNARIFKAFCDERRLRILAILREGEQCACVLMERMDMPQSSLSYHMKVLCESGVVVGRQEGKWTHYRISEKGSLEAVERLKALTASNATQQICDACCAES